MSDKAQSYAHHSRWHPVYHFVLVPVFLANVVASVVWVVREPGIGPAWDLVMAVALLLMLVLMRSSPLKVQDRVIRLEEQLRLMALLPEPLRARIPELSVDQLVGLRFASDAELPALAARAMNEKLDRKQIKQAIEHWRADDWRV